MCGGNLLHFFPHCLYPPAHSMPLGQELGISPRPGAASARSTDSENPGFLKK